MQICQQVYDVWTNYVIIIFTSRWNRSQDLFYRNQPISYDFYTANF